MKSSGSNALVCVAGAQPEYGAVTPGHVIQWPRDEGSHPRFRTEWWYLTGWLESETGQTFGFQVTFFRHRPGFDEHNPSRFAARQLLFAHASLSDPRMGKLLRAEKVARAGFGLAEAREGSLDVHIDDWRLRRAADGPISAQLAAERFRFDLQFASTQPPLLHGRERYSQKTPDPDAASYYYGLPQLQAQGRIWVDGEAHAVRGLAWLDHEWFSDILDASAQGWDWTGLNLDDGSALMALRMRNAQGEPYWAAATLRDAQGVIRTFGPREVHWQVLRRWRSPRTGIRYPVEVRVQVGGRTLHLRPLMDDQENDARASTGIIYWEGAMRALDASGRAIGRGYLELTGYGERIRL
ncbi:MAG: lipocalin-like domain-containing protein [Steroidobacteraceae bacterium]|nr:lipocalin-like domain-containing protein [Steroidobacteraceae bacterium]